MRHLFVGLLALASPHLSGAQSARGFFEVAVGASQGFGGEYRAPNGVSVQMALGVQQALPPSLVFGLRAGVLSIGGGDDICILSSSGDCLAEFPLQAFVVPTVGIRTTAFPVALEVFGGPSVTASLDAPVKGALMLGVLLGASAGHFVRPGLLIQTLTSTVDRDILTRVHVGLSVRWW